MDHRLFTALDCVIGGVVLAVSAMGTYLCSVVPSDAPNAEELKLMMLPLIGALISSGGMIMLNPSVETRRITIGRAVFCWCD